MGSFNETCMVSGLPIGYGDEVRVVVIKKSPYKESGCLVYPSDLWSPVSMPIRAKYDDYGNAYPIKEDETMAAFALGLLNTALEPIEQGENQYHDIAVKSLDSWDILLNACHEGRLRFKNSYSGVPWSPATRVMIREDVWQSMLKQKFSGWWGKSNLVQTLKDADEYFKHFVNIDDTYPHSKLLARMQAEHGGKKGPGWSYNFYAEGYSFIIKNVFLSRMEDKLTSGEWTLEDSLFKQISQAFSELAFVQYQFRYIGKMWTAMMTSGQEYHWKECMTFHQNVAKIAEALVKEQEKQRKYEEEQDRKYEAKLKEKKRKLAEKLAAKEEKK